MIARLAAVAAATLLAACATAPAPPPASAPAEPAATTVPETPTPTAEDPEPMTSPRVQLATSHGDVVLELDAEKAPGTVENFLSYVRSGHYDGTIFHRVIPNFMIQGGGFTPEMEQKPTGPPIQNEADNGLANTTGTIAMARTSQPHSASAQFFINTSDNAFLDHRSKDTQGWGYTVFGRVVEGMDVVRKIGAVPTGNRGGHSDVPLEPVVIEQATVVDE